MARATGERRVYDPFPGEVMPLHRSRQERLTGRSIALGLLLLASRPALHAADCNANCIEDSEELAEGAWDCNGNWLLDECELRLPGADFVASPVFYPGGSIESLVVADIDGDGLD